MSSWNGLLTVKKGKEKQVGDEGREKRRKTETEKSKGKEIGLISF